MSEEISKTTKQKISRILEIENRIIIIGPPATDPTASFSVYEVFIDENTKIEGEK